MTNNVREVWSPERGWSRQPLPFVLYGATFGLVMGLARHADILHAIYTAEIFQVVPSVLFSALAGLLVWALLRTIDYFRQRKRGSARQ